MIKEITFEHKKIAYTFRKSYRSKRVRLAVYRDGSVVLTSPVRLKESLAEKFINEKARWLFSKLTFFAQTPGIIPVRRSNRKQYLEHKEEARVLVHQKIEQFNQLYGYSYNRISIKDQKTCWGSCSRKKNLNFNYKIIALPERLQNYIIVHELAHLGEFSHSKQFWALVARGVPDYKELRRQLKSTTIGSL